MKVRHMRRTGTVLVESAMVYPVLFLLVMGLILLGIGVFRYHQVAHAAREGARWASVHGSQYASETGKAAATAADVYTNAIQPQLTGMSASDLTYSVNWNTSNAQYHTELRDVGSSTYPNGNFVSIANTVTVTVTYRWTPGIYFAPITLSSTSVATMSY